MNLASGYTDAQRKQIEIGRQQGLTAEQITLFARRELNESQMEQIRWGLEQGLPEGIVRIYANPRFDADQMRVVIWAIKSGWDTNELMQLVNSDPLPSAEEMFELYEALAKDRLG